MDPTGSTWCFERRFVPAAGESCKSYVYDRLADRLRPSQEAARVDRYCLAREALGRPPWQRVTASLP